MRIAILILLCIASSEATAALQTWEFVYVYRSTNFHQAQGQGDLTRQSTTLSGVLTDTRTVSYQINIKVRGSKASASFWPLESDVGASDLHGTFDQSQVAGECWQTIQLHDGLQFITLARNVPRCEP